MRGVKFYCRIGLACAQAVGVGDQVPETGIAPQRLGDGLQGVAVGDRVAEGSTCVGRAVDRRVVLVKVGEAGGRRVGVGPGLRRVLARGDRRGIVHVADPLAVVAHVAALHAREVEIVFAGARAVGAGDDLAQGVVDIGDGAVTAVADIRRGQSPVAVVGEAGLDGRGLARSLRMDQRLLRPIPEGVVGVGLGGVERGGVEVAERPLALEPGEVAGDRRLRHGQDPEFRMDLLALHLPSRLGGQIPVDPVGA